MIIYGIDLMGTFVFAISGAIVAYQKEFDVFGGFVLAAVTAVGGGTLRDVLIGRVPVGWIQDLNYLWAILLGVAFCYFFRPYVLRLRKTSFLFDAIGISLFTILGVQITLEQGLPIEIAILMGVISAVFGGVLRDVLSNQVPLIFRKEIYATACFAGAVLYALLEHFLQIPYVSITVSVLCILTIRILSATRHWTLPKMK